MASKYDDAQYQATKQVVAPRYTVTNTCKFSLVNAAILRNARHTVVTAGTSVGFQGVAGSGGVSIVCGTLTAGILIIGSDTAGTVMPITTLGNTLVPAGTPIQLLHGTDTTGVFDTVIEYSDAVA